MARKNKTISDTWRWGLYLVFGVLFMAGVVFFSSWQALRATEARFCQILDFVKSQSTSFEKHNDTITAKALRRTAVAVHQLAENPALDLSDPQCLNRQTEKLWLTGISVLGPDGTLRCESTTNGIGYDRFGDQLKNDAVLDVLSYPRKTYVKRVLLEDGSAVDVAAHRAESTELLLLAYRYTPAEFVEETALSIQSILDGYPAETSGTLFIVQNNQVVAANRPELIGQDVAGSPLAQGIRKAGAAEKLTHTRDWNGSGCYFGMFCHGRSFDLYAYTDEKIIFREALLLILTVLVGYILLVMILQLLRRRSVQEMEQQKKEQEKKYQAQLEEQNRKLEIALQHEGAANRAKREFLFNMSHDIRTPMNAIIGFSDLLEKHIDEKDRAVDYIAKIKSSSSFLLSLINYVLEMARIESGKASLKIELGSYSELIHSLNAVFEPSLKSKNLSYLCYNTVEHDAILCDRTKIREILLNIISNSIKYTPEGGKISVKIEETPAPRKGFASYRITVKDNGIGMSKEYLPHIFEEFTREHSSTESHITGTGLGLPIVKSLVNLMGGTIDVESELGAGTITTICLTFELPTEEQLAAHQHKDEILEQSLQTLSEKRVLLAEDNDLNAEIVLTVLEENGIHAEHVKDGALCLKAVQNAPEDYYDVILMDIQMPNMNGYQAAEAIRALPGKRGEIPIVAMTANAFEEDRRKALESGMNAHIAKPVDVSVLLETLSRFS